MAYPFHSSVRSRLGPPRRQVEYSQAGTEFYDIVEPTVTIPSFSERRIELVNAPLSPRDYGETERAALSFSQQVARQVSMRMKNDRISSDDQYDQYMYGEEEHEPKFGPKLNGQESDVSNYRENQNNYYYNTMSRSAPLTGIKRQVHQSVLQNEVAYQNEPVDKKVRDNYQTLGPARKYCKACCVYVDVDMNDHVRLPSHLENLKKKHVSEEAGNSHATMDATTSNRNGAPPVIRKQISVSPIPPVQDTTKQSSSATDSKEMDMLEEYVEGKVYGSDQIVSVSGSYCMCCHKFLSTEAARMAHSVSRAHYDNYYKIAIEKRAVESQAHAENAVTTKKEPQGCGSSGDSGTQPVAEQNNPPAAVHVPVRKPLSKSLSRPSAMPPPSSSAPVRKIIHRN